MLLVVELLPQLKLGSGADELVDEVLILRDFLESDGFWPVRSEVEAVPLLVVPFDLAANDVVPGH